VNCGSQKELITSMENVISGLAFTVDLAFAVAMLSF
jgi:hypothetical protein